MAEEDEVTNTWEAVGLCDSLCKRVNELGFVSPTPIQMNAIPPALEKKDVIGVAQTGSGKTAAYALPILHQLLESGEPLPNQTIAMVICPTRELAKQVAEHFTNLVGELGVRVLCLTGGKETEREQAELRKSVPHIVIGTPGRVRFHLEETQRYGMNKLRFLILDEADRMLNMRFEQEILAIIANLPVKRQTLLFSATMTQKVSELQKAALRDPIVVDVEGGQRYKTSSTLEQRYVLTPRDETLCYVFQVITELSPRMRSFILFADNGVLVQRLATALRTLGIQAAPLEGWMFHSRREAAIEDFRSGKTRVLVATNIAARGLDIPTVDCVILFRVPKSTKEYIHSAGRTARAGKPGLAIVMVNQYETTQLRELEADLGTRFEEYSVDEETRPLVQARVDQAWQTTLERLKNLEHSRQENRTGSAPQRQFTSADTPRPKRPRDSAETQQDPMARPEWKRRKMRQEETEVAALAGRKGKGPRKTLDAQQLRRRHADAHGISLGGGEKKPRRGSNTQKGGLREARKLDKIRQGGKVPPKKGKKRPASNACCR
eukprot:TRINITY_DN80142_c0_g1_i1.p1 TRINITY_DN80142_c0_g1~~TRINITY_DN80142_c0_g1_i1.p1  ORF type:complete len:563 (+),score=78.58 TRINITY_DN80142_c0_g1_i1:44-1690(+)